MLLSACSPISKTTQTAPSDFPPDWHIKDSGPQTPVDVAHIPDAVPRHEVRTKAGNKSPYTVLGKSYRVLPDSRGFVQEGEASWYGNKFHGRRTSNGEVYSMYGMTAAHKTLPIPSYVRVTNLENGRQVVVRVNDRGPFHGGRIIDLTYAAASKLGYLNKGTARVRVETVEPAGAQTGASVAVSYPVAPSAGVQQALVATAQSTSVVESAATVKAPAPRHSAGYELPTNTFLQAGAFSTSTAAEKLRQRIARLTALPVTVTQTKSSPLYRVRVGPIADNLMLMDLRSVLERHQLPSPHLVYD
ncbi:septal ring lytic transglycosylase RlpA family protein [Aestuariicella hydrocarbonica]|uniref:Endolytic peptidoglycan transglycosylase RlpA n=2 Tax=Pseudomaricurvus hydrocarbonicus TaxID=1470433 RepID=A0A9E5JT30_9GAMM|nr:septal ring lytic transglycosylase RlpA family protein [Aestuariicella hydrocarbonica]NHO64360.1 septal ring lytic transglycosylase RlpA family protein [Aestuariicella hydrocarbonica]